MWCPVLYRQIDKQFDPDYFQVKVCPYIARVSGVFAISPEVCP